MACHRFRFRRAFTLIELLVVIAIIAILIGLLNAKERFAKSYSDGASTDLKKSVAGGQKNIVDIELQ